MCVSVSVCVYVVVMNGSGCSMYCILVQCSAFLASGSDPTDDSHRKRFDT